MAKKSATVAKKTVKTKSKVIASKTIKKSAKVVKLKVIKAKSPKITSSKKEEIKIKVSARKVKEKISLRLNDLPAISDNEAPIERLNVGTALVTSEPKIEPVQNNNNKYQIIVLSEMHGRKWAPTAHPKFESIAEANDHGVQNIKNTPHWKIVPIGANLENIVLPRRN